MVNVAKRKGVWLRGRDVGAVNTCMMSQAGDTLKVHIEKYISHR